MTGVKDNIPFKEVKLGKTGRKDKITEWQTIEIPTYEKGKIRITNIYAPPIRSNSVKGKGQTRGESLAQEKVGSESTQQRSERPQQTGITTRRTRGESPNTYENLRAEEREDGDEEEEGTADETEDEREQQGIGRMYLESEGFDMTRWPHKNYDMIFGDVNAHSPLWDWVVERIDKRGEIIENWMASNDMVEARRTHAHQ